ncbi:hypothetical protein BCR44DRAFT_1292239 [Catenaria anguillulae PL171]|uniref:Uncharacterized protein n=1 Tax=Catenaria anguillulae PL171 TaxID=765915 RepID=A0A1Y2H7U9_9FUNG|nr:hypothetical protein BCR44DRAFT_1292239 [Catenaria anguillulae PL171]
MPSMPPSPPAGDSARQFYFIRAQPPAIYHSLNEYCPANFFSPLWIGGAQPQFCSVCRILNPQHHFGHNQSSPPTITTCMPLPLNVPSLPVALDASPALHLPIAHGLITRTWRLSFSSRTTCHPTTTRSSPYAHLPFLATTRTYDHWQQQLDQSQWHSSRAPASNDARPATTNDISCSNMSPSKCFPACGCVSHC